MIVLFCRRSINLFSCAAKDVEFMASQVSCALFEHQDTILLQVTPCCRRVVSSSLVGVLGIYWYPDFFCFFLLLFLLFSLVLLSIFLLFLPFFLFHLFFFFFFFPSFSFCPSRLFFAVFLLELIFLLSLLFLPFLLFTLNTFFFLGSLHPRLSVC